MVAKTYLRDRPKEKKKGTVVAAFPSEKKEESEFGYSGLGDPTKN